MNTTTNYPSLTAQFITENIGKEIIWHCYGDSSNLPYKGICKLLGIDGDKLIIEHIKGDDLSFARIEDGLVTYSDSGRIVRVGSAFDIYTIKINGMERDIVVYNDEDAQEKAKAVTTHSDFELILCI
jgi:hypothetical protein